MIEPTTAKLVLHFLIITVMGYFIGLAVGLTISRRK